MSKIGDFCEELIREILLSLPVKSLLRFKCVCKNWGTLINNPSFNIEHLNFSKKKPLQHLIYDYHAGEVVLVSDNGIDERNFQKFGDNSTTSTNMLGSIDGVFFFERRIIYKIGCEVLCALWNPANREVRHLPAASIEFEPFNTCNRNIGFGLDPMTRDYKVIYYNRREEYAALYSCSMDSWKIFKHGLDKYIDCLGSKYNTTNYLNGSYYWMWLSNEHTKCKILSFDFVDEVFVEMEGLSDGQGFYSCTAELISLGDSIAILSLGDDKSVYHVWVMILPGIWNKLATFHCFTFIKSIYDNLLILVPTNGRLVTYNVRTNKTKLLKFRHPRLGIRFDCPTGLGVYYYKESLVTIKR